MRHLTSTTALVAALGLAAAAPVTAQTDPSSKTSPSGGIESGGTGTMMSTISDDDVRAYVQVRQQLEMDPDLGRPLRSGDLSGEEQQIDTALATSGSQMSVEEFRRIHERVQTDPQLRARVQWELDSSGGTSGASGTVDPGQRAPLPSGSALGTGPATVAPGRQTPPGTRAPALGTGAPAPSDPDGGEGGASGPSR